MSRTEPRAEIPENRGSQMPAADDRSDSSDLTLLISPGDIAVAVNRLAQELDRDYAQSPPVLLGILKGAFVFLADLGRQMSVPIQSFEFMRVASYGADQTTSGEPVILLDVPEQAVSGRHVLLVEDIVDTGLTTTTVLDHLREFGPHSIRVCALLDKPSRRLREVRPDYVGFTIPDRFVVGYGLDFDQRYRELPGIYVLSQ